MNRRIITGPKRLKLSIYWIGLLLVFYSGIAQCSPQSPQGTKQYSGSDEEQIQKLLVEKTIEQTRKRGKYKKIFLSPYTQISEDDVKYGLAQAKSLKQETIDDFWSKNKEPSKLTIEDANQVYSLKEFSELDQIIGERNNSESHNSLSRKLNGGEVIICLSRVGFDKDRKQAFAYVFSIRAWVNLYETRTTYVLSRINGIWTVESEPSALHVIVDFF